MDNQKPIVELELYLIRHGQSRGNAGFDVENISLKDSNDSYLTDIGIEQAQRAGFALKDISFDSVYSSALLRAVQTATEIIKKQSDQKPLHILPYLTEMGIDPEYKGAGMDEIKSIYPEAKMADGLPENEQLIYHNSSEDEEGMFNRAEKAVSYLRERHKSGEKIAVINHGAFMTYAVFTIMGYTQCPVFDVSFKNTAVTKVVFYKEGTNKYGDIVFEYINSTNHLTNSY